MSLVALGCGVGIVPELVRDRSPLRSRVRVLTPSRELAELRVAVCAMRARVGQPTLHAFWSEVEGATR